MGEDRALDRDIELEQQDAEQVKAGGVSASVDGVASANLDSSSGAVNAAGVSVGLGDHGDASSGAVKGAGADVNLRSKRPTVSGTRRAVRRRLRRQP